MECSLTSIMDYRKQDCQPICLGVDGLEDDPVGALAEHLALQVAVSDALRESGILFAGGTATEVRTRDHGVRGPQQRGSGGRDGTRGDAGRRGRIDRSRPTGRPERRLPITKSGAWKGREERRNTAPRAL
ncbi:hypothetical protein B296_00010751 [Ensete ventricosum]|uniref:Uncharacterized protein n=1 Tax=Ensete ventricosum TaxID=4639 RepID=A0A427B8R3_ENSVE|nr:hypothetical protein B296_00010751 [Ensete ventricosum]